MKFLLFVLLFSVQTFAQNNTPSVGYVGQPSKNFMTEVGGVGTSNQYVPLHFDSGNNLNVTFGGGVAVTSFLPNPLPITISGTSVTQPVSSVGLFDVSGSGVSVTNVVAVTTGAPLTVNQGTSPWIVGGGVAVTNSPTVSVSNFPATQNVNITGTSVTQPVSGTVSISGSGVSVTNIPMVNQGTSPWVVGGGVAVTNTPAVTGSGNFTVTQGTGTNLHTVVDSGSIALSAGVSVTNTVSVSGSGISVTNSPSVKLATPTALTVTQAQVTIGTSAARLTVNGSAPAATRVVLSANLDAASTASCYLGSSSVTSSGATRGVPMPAGQVFVFNNDAGDYYAICGTATQTFYLMEQE